MFQSALRDVGVFATGWKRCRRALLVDLGSMDCHLDPRRFCYLFPDLCGTAQAAHKDFASLESSLFLSPSSE